MASAGRRAKHALEDFGFRLLAGVIRGLPRAVALRLGTGLGRFAFDVVGIRRQVAIENVLETLKPAGGEPEAARVARSSYEVMGRTFIDLIRLDRIGENSVWKILSRSEFEPIGRFRERKQGVVFLSGHFGNWEFAALGIRHLGVPIHAIAGEQANSAVNDYLVDVRGRAGIPTLSARHGLRDALDILRRHEAVATLADQDAGRKGIFAEFLGRPSRTHTGMVSMAVRTQCPLMAGVVIDEGGRYRFVFTEPWFPQPGATEADNFREGALYFNRFLEEQVRRHPDNYFWAHRRWKTRPEDGA